MGVGFVPELMAQPWIKAGQLVTREVERPRRESNVSYAWRIPDGSEGERGGRALQWWLQQLKKPTTRSALLVNPRSLNPDHSV
jgi:DNA-binding transcriptional LysR family regulator